MPEDTQPVEFKEVVKDEQKPETVINIDNNTAFSLKLQEFDKNIAIAEAQVADLKKQKFSYIYDSNVQLIMQNHKASLIEQQTKEEVAKRLAQADAASK